MKHLLSRFLALSIFAAVPLHALIIPSLSYSESFTQTSTGVQPLFPTLVAATVVNLEGDGLPTDSADAAFVTRPDGTSMIDPQVFSGEWGWIAFWTDSYPTSSDALFGDYVFSFSGGSQDGTSEVLSLDPKLMPPPIPELTKSSFALLTAAEVSKPIRLVFRPWMLRGLGTMDEFSSGTFDKDILGWIGISITALSGEIAFAIPAADPRTATVVIPANSLKAGTIYNFTLRYQTQADSSKVSYARELQFQFTSKAAVPNTR
jgi:hypothetical protein